MPCNVIAGGLACLTQRHAYLVLFMCFVTYVCAYVCALQILKRVVS